MDLENLKLLETKIDHILTQHEKMRRERDAMSERIKDLEGQVAQAAGKLKQQEQERGELKTRLERILSRLESLDLG